MTDLLVERETVVLVEEAARDVLMEREARVELLTEGRQGPQGIRGPAGPAGGATVVKVGAQAISGHTAVACDASGSLVAADCTEPAHRGAVLGLVADAYSPGEDAVVQTGFVLEHAGWSWSPGPILLGLSGRPAQVLPAGALFAQILGQALSPTRVLIDVNPPISLA